MPSLTLTSEIFGQHTPGVSDGKDWAALAAYIESRRTELGLSVEDAARRAKTSDTSWRQLEKGRRLIKSGEEVPPNPRRDLLGRIAIALDVPIAAIDWALAGNYRTSDGVEPALPPGTAGEGTIDVSGLPAEDVAMIEQQVRRLKRLHGLEE